MCKNDIKNVLIVQPVFITAKTNVTSVSSLHILISMSYLPRDIYIDNIRILYMDSGRLLKSEDHGVRGQWWRHILFYFLLKFIVVILLLN